MNTKDFKTRSETIHRAAPCPANHWIIGLDIGYSAIKGMSPNKIYSVPAYARKIPADRVRLNEPSETDIYYKAENGDIWVVGSLAYNELSASDVIDSEQELFGRKRYYSDMFRVISDTGIAIGLMGNDKGNSKGKKLTIQTGLPPKYLKADQNDLKEVLSGHHHFSLRIGRAPWQQFDFVVDSKDILLCRSRSERWFLLLSEKMENSLPLQQKSFQRIRLCLIQDLEPAMITLSIMVVLSMKTHSRILGCGRSFQEHVKKFRTLMVYHYRSRICRTF